MSTSVAGSSRPPFRRPTRCGICSPGLPATDRRHRAIQSELGALRRRLCPACRRHARTQVSRARRARGFAGDDESPRPATRPRFRHLAAQSMARRRALAAAVVIAARPTACREDRQAGTSPAYSSDEAQAAVDAAAAARPRLPYRAPPHSTPPGSWWSAAAGFRQRRCRSALSGCDRRPPRVPIERGSSAWLAAGAARRATSPTPPRASATDSPRL
jgi:hypothetical protein